MNVTVSALGELRSAIFEEALMLGMPIDPRKTTKNKEKRYGAQKASGALSYPYVHRRKERETG